MSQLKGSYPEVDKKFQISFANKPLNIVPFSILLEIYWIPNGYGKEQE